MRGLTLAGIDFPFQIGRERRGVCCWELNFPEQELLEDIAEMEEPSTSKMNAEGPADADMEIEVPLPVARKRYYPEEDGEDIMGDESSDESDEGFRTFSRRASHRRFVLGWLEIPTSVTLNYGKKKKLNCGHSRQSPDFYDDDDSSNSSSLSISSHSDEIYVEPRYVAPNSENYPNIHEPVAEPGPMSYNNADHILHGYWIIFSNEQGGWPYPIVKMFVQRQLKLDAIRGKPWPGQEPGPDDFRLIVSFSSRDERDKILNELMVRHVSAFFSYVVTDTLPMGSYDFDRDAEDEQWYSTEILRRG